MKRKKRGKPAKKVNRLSVRSRLALAAVLLALALLGGLCGWMALQARITHVRKAVVYLTDLPPEMSGVTLLYVSDLNIRGGADARRSRHLMQQLAELEPDVLLLGGDYCGGRLLDGLPYADAGGQAAALDFLRSLRSFPAPLGKFAVAGEQDCVLAGLEEAMAEGGVDLLDDECATIQRDGAQLVLAGMSDVSEKRTPYAGIGGYVDGSECVIALTHNPSGYIGVRVAEARSGGAWADLVLAGHTLGGQIKAFGRTIYTLPEAEARCLGGWYYAGDLPMLVSQGVGCSGVQLRLGTTSEVWLIELRRPEQLVLPDFTAE